MLSYKLTLFRSKMDRLASIRASFNSFGGGGGEREHENVLVYVDRWLPEIVKMGFKSKIRN